LDRPRSGPGIGSSSASKAASNRAQGRCSPYGPASSAAAAGVCGSLCGGRERAAVREQSARRDAAPQITVMSAETSFDQRGVGAPGLWLTKAENRSCHLCNTRPKRHRQPCDFAVFPLCVQPSSLRLDTRRRGASPGRPVQVLKFASL
jgi:hypothetical protein